MSLPNPKTPLAPPLPSNLTAHEATTLVNLSTLIQTALYYGVLDSSGNPLIPSINSKYQQSKPEVQQMVIDTYRGVLAALIQAQAGLSTVVSYTKPDTTTGVLVFTNGILTSSS